MHSSNEKALALEERTARGYRRALLRVVYCGTLQLEGRYAPIGRLTPEQRKEAEQMPVTSLTRQLARAYLQSATEEIEEFDQLESAKRTANMTLRQAKSVFSQEALEVYEDALHLPLPDVSQFKSKKPLPVEVPKYCLPPTDTLKALFHFYDSLPLRSPMWIAVSLGLFSGLRRSEVIAARYTWLSDSQGDQIHVQTESDFKPKGKKSRRVPVPCQIYAQLMKHKALATDNFLLKEAELGREKVIDDLNQHLRKIFPETQKPFHELRKLYGCWIANTEGIREAQRRLGHVSVDTTEKHYADINMTGEISQSFTISLEVING